MYSPVSFMLEILWKEYIKVSHESIGMHTRRARPFLGCCVPTDSSLVPRFYGSYLLSVGRRYFY